METTPTYDIKVPTSGSRTKREQDRTRMGGSRPHCSPTAFYYWESSNIAFISLTLHIDRKLNKQVFKKKNKPQPSKVSVSVSDM